MIVAFEWSATGHRDAARARPRGSVEGRGMANENVNYIERLRCLAINDAHLAEGLLRSRLCAVVGI